MKSVLSSRLKSLADQVRQTLYRFQSTTASIPRSTATRIGPNRVIFRTILNDNCSSQNINNAYLSKKSHTFYLTSLFAETVIVSYGPKSAGKIAETIEQNAPHQVLLKVKLGTKNLTVTYQDQHARTKLIQQILIE